ncbi:hypothetical protein BO78DRAFT_385923 [Aspergillus sclerotiicarbonarius CBS 121057]|uniref:Uncharacterized protein n=1 Tax=Aspergillus sclerotiicarbonarius (strain CBS 121057 / IBT 28362) TaxID=1448318 RepID=A0A319FIY4_ASPSB|nr:hypothetical protein BO78DRAFT_385923 [Aspergillus sclerotiicarbonarius CBS 121057]
MPGLLNSVHEHPTECHLSLMRWMELGETAEDVLDEMDRLVKGLDATLATGELHDENGTVWKANYLPFYTVGFIDSQNPLTRVCLSAYEKYSVNLMPRNIVSMNRASLWECHGVWVSQQLASVLVVQYIPSHKGEPHQQDNE